MFDGWCFTWAFAPLNGYGGVVRALTAIEAPAQLLRAVLKLVVRGAAGTW